MRTRDARWVALAAIAGALTGGCSDSSTTAAATKTAAQVISPGAAAPGGQPVTVGPVTVSLPGALHRQSGASPQQVLFVGDPGPDGRRAALSVGYETSDRLPKDAAQKLADYKRDIDQVKDVDQAPATWPGFTEVYGVAYDDPMAPGATEPLHAVAFIGRTANGQMVNVTAKAPRSLFDSLALQRVVESTRLAADGATGTSPGEQ